MPRTRRKKRRQNRTKQRQRTSNVINSAMHDALQSIGARAALAPQRSTRAPTKRLVTNQIPSNHDASSMQEIMDAMRPAKGKADRHLAKHGISIRDAWQGAPWRKDPNTEY